MTDIINLEVIRSLQHYVLMDIISNSYTCEAVILWGPKYVGKYAWASDDPADPDYQPGIRRHMLRMYSYFCLRCGNYRMINALNISHYIWCTCFNHYRNRNRNHNNNRNHNRNRNHNNHNHIRTISRLFLFLFYYFIEFILMKLFIFLLLIFNT